MTTYKLLIDSPKYEKTLKQIKTIAKREKKQIEMTGADISFVGCVYNAIPYSGAYRPPIHKEVTGAGIIVRLL